MFKCRKKQKIIESRDETAILMVKIWWNAAWRQSTVASRGQCAATERNAYTQRQNEAFKSIVLQLMKSLCESVHVFLCLCSTVDLRGHRTEGCGAAALMSTSKLCDKTIRKYRTWNSSHSSPPSFYFILKTFFIKLEFIDFTCGRM